MKCKISESEGLSSSKEDLRSPFTSEVSKNALNSSKREVEKSNTIQKISEEEEKSEKQISTPQKKK